MGDFSSFLGTVSFLGFVLFIAGIALAIVASSQGRKPRGGVMLAVIGLIVGILFSIISGGILIVKPAEVAVIVNTLTGKLEEPRSAGASIVIPVLQTYQVYPINQQTYIMSSLTDEGNRGGDDSVEATTKDGQIISLDVTVFFSIDPGQVNKIHVNWNSNYEQYIRSTSRTAVRDIVAQYRAEDIYGERRADLIIALNLEIQTKLANEGFKLNRVDVRGLTFSEGFRQAIELKLAAEQAAQQAAFVVEQKQREAEQARAVAEGERDATIARAEGEAQSIILRAQAEAQALELVSLQISKNPLLIQYMYVQNLSDNVSVIMLPNSSPFLFDANSLGIAVP